MSFVESQQLQSAICLAVEGKLLLEKRLRELEICSVMVEAGGEDLQSLQAFLKG